MGVLLTLPMDNLVQRSSGSCGLPERVRKKRKEKRNLSVQGGMGPVDHSRLILPQRDLKMAFHQLMGWTDREDFVSFTGFGS